MINIKKIFIILFLYIFLTPSVYAENKIAYLDLDFILSNTNIGKITLSKLEKNEKKKNDEFKLQEKNLKKKRIKF